MDLKRAGSVYSLVQKFNAPKQNCDVNNLRPEQKITNNRRFYYAVPYLLRSFSKRLKENKNHLMGRIKPFFKGKTKQLKSEIEKINKLQRSPESAEKRLLSSSKTNGDFLKIESDSIQQYVPLSKINLQNATDEQKIDIFTQIALQLHKNHNQRKLFKSFSEKNIFVNKNGEKFNIVLKGDLIRAPDKTLEKRKYIEYRKKEQKKFFYVCAKKILNINSFDKFRNKIFSLEKKIGDKFPNANQKGYEFLRYERPDSEDLNLDQYLKQNLSVGVFLKKKDVFKYELFRSMGEIIQCRFDKNRTYTTSKIKHFLMGREPYWLNRFYSLLVFRGLKKDVS